MKKILLTLTVLSISSTLLLAQTTSSTVKNPGGFYIKGGVNFANISTQNDGDVNDANTLTTFHVGGLADVPIGDMFSFQTGLFLSGKGAKTASYLDDNNTSDNYIKTKFNPLYLEIPANLVLKFGNGNGSGFFLGAGPYGAFGIAGKAKTETKILGSSSSTESDLEFKDDDDDNTTNLKRFDYGLNFLAGVELNKFVIGANYGLGLAKIYDTGSDDDDNNKNKYRTFSISVGFKL